MTIAITGHRPHKLDNDYELKSPLMLSIKEEVKKILKEYNPDQIISGMALGIDTLFAELGIELEIPVIAAIPFMDQDKIWPLSSKIRYRKILTNPLVEAVYIDHGAYSAQKMQDRNKWMVDKCDLLIAVWDGSNGGTGNCIKYAKDIKRKVIYIDPNKFRK